MDSREQMNFSGLTNYRASKPAAIFDEGNAGPRSLSRTQEGRAQEARGSSPGSQSPSRRKFNPVLKSKSYLNQDLNNLKSQRETLKSKQGMTSFDTELNPNMDSR